MNSSTIGMESTLKTTLLLGGLSGLLVTIGWLLGGNYGAFFALIFAAFTNLGAWWFSDQIALSMNHARPVDAAQNPTLHQMVETLALRAGIPKPGVYMIDSPMPNAFATGRSPEKGAVAVTTGIMQALEPDELAGVIAHELAHIKHRDTLISSIAATIAGAITMLAQMAQHSLMWGGISSRRSSSDSNGGAEALRAIAAILMVLLAPLAAAIIQMAISRAREFKADAGGAEIMGNPLPLADALMKLERGVSATANQPQPSVNPVSAPLYIVNPLHGGTMQALFSTHPPTAERIRRLKAMAGQA
ncbi:MAG TPA: zinc metalloprotease HtpX [Aggregatilineales bacterium]|nr:zinc metalloprotease HtpX [Aggregatilineales bacterium]